MNPAVLAHFSEQSKFCREFGSPFTADLIDALSEDLKAGGPTAELVASWPGAPRKDALALRLTGALHAAALTERDPALAAEYPAARPDWSAERVWTAARSFLARELAWVSEFIRSAPQTNETRRSIALLLGFLTLAQRHRLPLDLLELGASAGLNQCWDLFHYRTRSWQWGEPSSIEIETEWHGAPPPLEAMPQVRSRAACDLDPPDITLREQVLRLRSYVWADQRERLARFDASVQLALAQGIRVERADAAEWLERRLAQRASGALTVVYHSIFYQYPPRATRERIREVIEHSAGYGAGPVAWLRLEPEAVIGGPSDSLRLLVDLITYPEAERTILALTDGHVRFVDTRPASIG